MRNKRISLHIYPSKIMHETRIEKICKVILESKIATNVIIYGINDPKLEKQSSIFPHAEVIRVEKKMVSPNLILKALSFFLWSIKVYRSIPDNQIVTVHAHSLSVFPLAFMIKIWKEADLVYEPHEFEIDTSNSGLVKRTILKNLEKRLIKHADLFYVVSEEIAIEYSKHYPSAQIEIIRNIPEEDRSIKAKLSCDNLRKEYGLFSNEVLFLYQGILAPERGTEMICSIFAECGVSAHVLFIGEGESEKYVESMANLHPNIHLKGMLSESDLKTITSQCDVGLVHLDDSCLNHELALPNKFFQYLQAQIPVLAVNRRQLREYVEKHDLGWVYQTKDEFKALVSSIQKSEIEGKKTKIEVFNLEHNWEKEKAKLMNIYLKLKEDSTRDESKTH
jgi:glycosyltransferase involved in cell wall biosynthesis